jgi:tRNA G18 (ribose-2'-O)-methylase SpoU
MALLVGREVEGIDPALLQQVDDILEIPMFGSKESFNVAQATAIALYQLRTAS